MGRRRGAPLPTGLRRVLSRRFSRATCWGVLRSRSTPTLKGGPVRSLESSIWSGYAAVSRRFRPSRCKWRLWPRRSGIRGVRPVSRNFRLLHGGGVFERYFGGFCRRKADGVSAAAYIIISALGAQLRHIFAEFLDFQTFPWGIALSNIAACAIVVAVAKCANSGGEAKFLAAGFAATLSTFSSLNYGLLKMLRARRYCAAFFYFSISALSAFAVAVSLS